MPPKRSSTAASADGRAPASCAPTLDRCVSEAANTAAYRARHKSAARVPGHSGGSERSGSKRVAQVQPAILVDQERAQHESGLGVGRFGKRPEHALEAAREGAVALRERLQVPAFLDEHCVGGRCCEIRIEHQGAGGPFRAPAAVAAAVAVARCRRRRGCRRRGRAAADARTRRSTILRSLARRARGAAAAAVRRGGRAARRGSSGPTSSRRPRRRCARWPRRIARGRPR